MPEISYRCKSPILLLVFNRPETTRLVFESIKKARPERLYVACDGPRSHVPDELDLVKEVQAIATAVDWDCEVQTLFRKQNLSCGPAVSEAITWFFSHESSGIILEDDTVPDESFFPFCEDLLDRYADDERIGMISGNNHLPEYTPENSYFFSKFKWTWGWASWRRAWIHQDLVMKFRDSPQASSIIKNMGYRSRSERLWKINISKLEKKSVNTWDFQWFLAMGAQNQLSIVPRQNLVANIGFGVEGATHCSGSASSRYLEKHSLSFPLQHPQYVVPDYSYEAQYESTLIGDGRGWGRYLPKPFKALARKWLSKHSS